MLFIYFGAPLVGVPLKPFAAALLSLTLWGGANGAEIVRGGIKLIRRHQFVSATALDLKRWEIIAMSFYPGIDADPAADDGLLHDARQAASLASLVGVNEFFVSPRSWSRRTTMQSGHSPRFSSTGSR